ncbi:MAG: histidine phosphatase family protein [Tahibacter sp.]
MTDSAMERVLLIRHAQASFGSDDYDQLSERGHVQAELLARWLIDADLDIRAVSVGAQKRHAQTLQAIEAAASSARRPLPIPVVDTDWNEFDHERLLRGYAAWAPHDPDLDTLQHGKEPHRLQALLGRAFHAWNDGHVDTLMPETLAAFRARVADAHARVSDRCNGGTALVISSGGAISRCAQMATNLDEPATIALNMRLANSGIVEFERRQGAWTIARWSDLPHLAHPEHAHLKTWY